MPKSQKKKKSVKKSVKKKTTSKRKKTGIKPVKTAGKKIHAEITTGIKEIELELEDLVDVSEERASIISIVKGLEGQVETAFMLKDVLETELDTTQLRLSEEMDARMQLEVQVDSLQAQAALVEQLHQDISFTEDERNKFADELTQIRQEFEQTVVERDLLRKQVSCFETRGPCYEP